MLKPLCGSQQTGKFFKRWEYQTTWPAFWETCMQMKKQQLEPDMEQWNSFKIGKGVHQGCILSPCLFNSHAEDTMGNARPDEAQAGLETPGEMPTPHLCQWCHSNGRAWRGTREHLDEGERGGWKGWLKTQYFEKLRSWPLVPLFHGK